MKPLKTVERRAALQLVVSCDYSLPVCVRLRHEPDDPYVVRAAFFLDGDEPVEWILGRDVLADGLKGFAGSADVRTWPAPEPDIPAMYIALGSSAGTALLEAPVRDIKSLLDDTEALVPRGTEERKRRGDAARRVSGPSALRRPLLRFTQWPAPRLSRSVASRLSRPAMSVSITRRNLRSWTGPEGAASVGPSSPAARPGAMRLAHW